MATHQHLAPEKIFNRQFDRRRLTMRIRTRLTWNYIAIVLEILPATKRLYRLKAPAQWIDN